MPLESLTGSNVFIDDLNELWPLGTDLPDAGDDHIRGIKNVLLNTFPLITGEITRSHEDINRGSVPAGSIAAFFQAAAPAGWTRVAGILESSLLRLVPSTTAGGGTGGVDAPEVMDKVPSHTHGISGTSAASTSAHTHPFTTTTDQVNAAHSHPASSGAAGAHSHTLNIFKNGARYSAGTTAMSDTGSTRATADAAATHTHTVSVETANATHSHTLSGSTGAQNAEHTHAISLTSAANPGAITWQPRYTDMILCQKS